jgi:hypothetical protein
MTAVILLCCFVALEIRHWFRGGRLDGSFGFTQATLHLRALAVQATAYLYLARRSGRIVLDWAWRIVGGAALAYGTLLLVLNPAVTGDRTGVFALLAAYLIPATLGLVARAGERLFRLMALGVIGLVCVKVFRKSRAGLQHSAGAAKYDLRVLRHRRG